MPITNEGMQALIRALQGSPQQPARYGLPPSPGMMEPGAAPPVIGYAPTPEIGGPLPGLAEPGPPAPAPGPNWQYLQARWRNPRRLYQELLERKERERARGARWTARTGRPVDPWMIDYGQQMPAYPTGPGGQEEFRRQLFQMLTQGMGMQGQGK